MVLRMGVLFVLWVLGCLGWGVGFEFGMIFDWFGFWGGFLCSMGWCNMCF